MKRSLFIGSSSAATAGLVGGAERLGRHAAGPRKLLAPRLRKGDAVGIVAPAGPAHSRADVDRARLHVEMLGLRPVFGDHVFERNGYLAGPDASRRGDFNRFVRDRRIRAIFALRGGYGTMRILDDIDYAGLSEDPKVVLGFSDITALLNAITTKTGLVTFHGPALARDDFPSDVIDGLKRAVMRGEPLGLLRSSGARSVCGGTARGTLAGGNLSIVAALSGGPFAVPCEGRVLILEDVREAPYRVDRMLTTLRINGDLGRVSAIGLGMFPLCIPGPNDDVPSQSLDEVFDDRLCSVKKPVVRGLRFGHVEHPWTLPLGVMATVDAGAGTLTVEEPAVH